MTAGGRIGGWGRRDRTRRAAATTACAIGGLGLLSALSAPARTHLQVIIDVVPTIAPETAGVTLVFASFALILMARGLRRGLRAAWAATVALLVMSVGIHVVHESVALTTVPPAAAAIWLAGRRSCFPVAQSPHVVRRAMLVVSTGVVAALILAATLAAALDQNRRFAPPVLVAIGLCALTRSLWSLLSPHRRDPADRADRTTDERRARAVVAAHGGDTLAYFALRDDKQWFFSGDSVVAYAIKNGVCVVSPDPVGPPHEREAVWAAFTTFAESHGWTVSVLGASAPWLPVYEHSGLRSVYLGDEAIIDCRTFTTTGRAMRSVRQAHSRARRAGYSVVVVDPARATPELRARLQSIASLCRHGAFERGFSMTLSRLFDTRDDGLTMSIAVDTDGVPQAFIQWVPCEGGWSLDVMRRNTDPSLTNGIIDYLIIESVLAFTAGGATRVGLNFAVFRTVISGENTDLLGRAARNVIHRAASQTQIESLWRFTVKFSPQWIPRYAVLGSVDVMAAQGLVMAGAEGLTELPVVGRFMTGMTAC